MAALRSLLLLVVLALLLPPATAAPLPIVIMHGMGDFANNPNLIRLRDVLSKHLNGSYVRNIPLVTGTVLDYASEFFITMDGEVAAFARKVKADPNLAHGFNAIGISQGALIIRGYLQRYNEPPVVNFISMHGPMAGVSGFPRCPYTLLVCRLFAHFLGDFAYTRLAQTSLAQSNYLRDPKRIPEYLSARTFLADLNNELPEKNETYRTNFMRLRKLVLVKALKDTMVSPAESEWFGYYMDGSDRHVLPMLFTPWFATDAFGLRSLDILGRVFLESTNGDHTEFTDAELLQLVDLYFL